MIGWSWKWLKVLAESGVCLVAVVEENRVRCATISVACRSRLCTWESATAVLCRRVAVSFCRGVSLLLMGLRCRGVQ